MEIKISLREDEMKRLMIADDPRSIVAELMERVEFAVRTLIADMRTAKNVRPS